MIVARRSYRKVSAPRIPRYDRLMPKPPCFPPPWCVEDPATRLELTYPEAEILATIGVVALADVTWVVGNLIDQKMSSDRWHHPAV